MRLTKTRNKYGGEVIGAGGYGCVFNPALRCNNSKKRTSGISKLSRVFDSNKEWNEIQRVKRYLEKIPNYKNYFLLSDQNKCTPSALTEKDKNNLELCDSILKIVGNIDRENINSNLQKLQIINMPYGGKSLHNILINNIVPIENINIILINLLINGININGDYFTLETLIKQADESGYVWEEPEWGFPKGRRNYMEKDFDCAIREFSEETGYSSKLLLNISNLFPFEEVFTGSNYKSYKHKYYIGNMAYEHTIDTNCFQKSEVSKMEWKNFNESINSIRNYNLEKINLLTKINEIIKTHMLFSI